MKKSGQWVLFVVVGLALSGCLKKRPEVSPLASSCVANSTSFSGCTLFASSSDCVAVSGPGCTNVALMDPLTGAASVCSGFPASGCSGPLTIGQNTTGGGGGNNNGNNNGNTSGTTGPVPTTCGGAPSLSIVESQNLNFGKHFVGTADYFRTFTLKNQGSGTCPAVLGNFGVGSSPDFEVTSAGSCDSGTSLAVNAQCTIQVKMKSISAGSKSAQISVPYSYESYFPAPASFSLSSLILADDVAFPGVTFPSGQTSSGGFQNEVIWTIDEASNQCVLANSDSALYYNGVTVTTANSIRLSVSLEAYSGVSAVGGIAYFGKKTGVATCWSSSSCFNNTPIVITGTETVYFKNISNGSVLPGTPARRRARISYRSSDAPLDAPNKVKDIGLVTWCY